MLSDNVAIALALGAVWLAGRPSTPERTYGYKRAEVLVALANGVALVALAIWIFYAASGGSTIRRRSSAAGCSRSRVVGIVVNLAAAAILSRAARRAQRRGRVPARARRPARLARRRRGCGRDPRDGMARGGPGRRHAHRRPRPRELVVDPARLDPDPARGGAERHRHARGRRAARARAGCRGGARPAHLDDHAPDSRRSRRTFSSAAARTATAAGASSSAAARRVRHRAHDAPGRPRGRAPAVSSSSGGSSGPV